MLAFHGKQEIKDKYIARVKSHYKADEIIKGKYWENGKGCAIGCTIHGSSHSAYEKELGISRIIARLEDGIFQALPNDVAKKFPLRFLNAIKVGADLSGVFNKFMYWLLVDETDGVIKFFKKPEQIKAIQAVADLFARRIAGEKVDLMEWHAVRATAAAYAAYAAAAAAAAAVGAVAAVDAYVYAAADAAYAVDADVYAAATARRQARLRQADKLIELLENAPVPEQIAA
jgi:hypothetical protein